MESAQEAADISPVRAHGAAESRVAAVLGSDSARIQVLFAELARRWQRMGLRVAGVVEETRTPTGNTCGDLVLRDLVNDAIYPISQRLGRGSRSCNLDSDGLAQACAALESSVRSGCDLVVISKFGKQEAAGDGLVDAFAAAIAADIPVLTAVAEPWRAQWLAFSAPLSEFVPAEARAIEAWRKRHGI